MPFYLKFKVFMIVWFAISVITCLLTARKAHKNGDFSFVWGVLAYLYFPVGMWYLLRRSKQVRGRQAA